VGLGLLAGCLAQRVEDAPAGTFVCAVQNDCDEGQHCILGVCEAAPGPRLEIRHPEAFDRLDMPDDPTSAITIPISVGGSNLDLREPHAAADVLGSGYIELLVDDDMVARLTSGNLVAGVAAEVVIPAVPGAHRITAIARTPDGARYDNLEATGKRLVWVDDRRPHVAIVEPWPGEAYSLQETDLEIQLAALNFTFVPFDVQGEGPSGHAHVHYDDPFPACVDDPSCDCCYVAVVVPDQDADTTKPIEGYVELPPAAAGSATLSAVLRDTYHVPLFDESGRPIWDTVPILRVDIPPTMLDEHGEYGESSSG
jgi:hypothetical protein